MTPLELRPANDQTSAAGPMMSRQVREPMLIGCLIAGLGTSAATTPPADTLAKRIVLQTSAGQPFEAAVKAQGVAALAELRRISGLKWEQLAQLFQVSRRALHFWASGKPMTAANEGRLQSVLAVVRDTDRGMARENRAALLAVHDGHSALSLLASGEYERARSVLGERATLRRRPPRISPEERLRRAPPPPEKLGEGEELAIPRGAPKVRAAKTVRHRGGD